MDFYHLSIYYFNLRRIKLVTVGRWDRRLDILVYSSGRQHGTHCHEKLKVKIYGSEGWEVEDAYVANI